MCIFSRPAQAAQTNIFARSSQEGHQYLVYSMKVKAEEELAMILPLPVPQPSPEEAIHWINLKEYPNFFEDMADGFYVPTRGGDSVRFSIDAKPQLAVVSVGDFEASFVPTLHDFDRLDARFKLPAQTWENIPQYHDYGFAVFKLKPEAKKYSQIHPMAFEFPRAHPECLFFPTVHIHDGQVHATAQFDHALFYQRSPEDTFTYTLTLWEESPHHARQFMAMDKCHGMLLPDKFCYRLGVKGKYRNEDIWLR